MYSIEAHWEVGPTPRAIHAFYVNGERAGTRVEDVRKVVQGPSSQQVRDACRLAKDDGYEIEIVAAMAGWTVRRAA